MVGQGAPNLSCFLYKLGIWWEVKLHNIDTEKKVDTGCSFGNPSKTCFIKNNVGKLLWAVNKDVHQFFILYKYQLNELGNENI